MDARLPQMRSEPSGSRVIPLSFVTDLGGSFLWSKRMHHIYNLTRPIDHVAVSEGSANLARMFTDVDLTQRR